MNEKTLRYATGAVSALALTVMAADQMMNDGAGFRVLGQLGTLPLFMYANEHNPGQIGLQETWNHAEYVAQAFTTCFGLQGIGYFLRGNKND
ncbi:hypothetical protein HOC01_01520 [archaeon]|jgi:hypothetical protein|nr:hypothetical protein [archaeon]MBT6698002.1 hypothetical protein [archaeon]